MRPPLRLLASARAAHRQGRIGATIVAALLGTAVHEVASDVTANGTAVAHDRDAGHGRDAATTPATGPDPAPRGGDPDDLADEAAAVFADL